MTFVPFRHLQPSLVSGQKKPEHIERFLVHDPAYTDTVDSAYNLVNLATAVFIGIYPKESVYFWWGESTLLPWHSEEYLSSQDRIASEVKAVVGVLGFGGPAMSDTQCELMTYLHGELCSNPASVTRALCVEVFLNVDEFLDLLVRRRFDVAIPRFATAFSCYVEAIANARDNLTSAQAGRAASFRHQENREIRDQAIAFYIEHRDTFRSIDEAALAITKVVPIAFATARRYVVEQRRSMRRS